MLLSKTGSKHRSGWLGFLWGVLGLAAVASITIGILRAESDPFSNSMTLWFSLAGVILLHLILVALLGERFLTERRFHHRERLFRSVVDDCPALICELDSSGVVLFVNRSYVRAVGKSVPLVGRPFLEGTSSDPTSSRTNLDSLRPDGESLTLEVLTQAHDSNRWHRWVIHAIGDRNGHRIGYQAVGVDVTEFRKLEEERRSLDARVFATQKADSLNVIAGGMAHEFNNLLTVIIGNAELTTMTLPEDAPARSQLEQIEQAARRATDLTRQLLAYAGKGKVLARPTDLNLLLREIRLHSALPAGVTLNIEPSNRLPKVLADESQMRQMLVNLLANAIEALDGKAGTVTIRTDSIMVSAPKAEDHATEETHPGWYVRLQISDTGAGMNEAVLVRIFEPFYTTKFTGRGLGLAAVQGIVRTHGGTVSVRSSPGHGTEFTVLLPAEHANEVAMRARPIALVIDADEGDCVPGHRALADLNWEVILVADTTVGVQQFRRSPERYDLVLVGLSPDSEAETRTLEVIRRIRPDVPILICARLTEYSLPDLTPFRPAAFLLKPYGTDDVREAIERVKNVRNGKVGNGH